MSTESLNFVVSLSGDFWDRLPQYTILLDDTAVASGTSLGDIAFQQDLEKGEHTLKIRLENKLSSDTVVESGVIVKDMLLNINDIVIDDISLGNLLWSAEYILDEPQEYQGQTITYLDHCVNLGWNGTYILKFTSPVYMWLLEKL